MPEKVAGHVQVRRHLREVGPSLPNQVALQPGESSATGICPPAASVLELSGDAKGMRCACHGPRTMTRSEPLWGTLRLCLIAAGQASSSTQLGRTWKYTVI